MKWLIALEILLLSLNAAEADSCTIAIIDNVGIFEHELAHCSGWTHPPYASGMVPPREYVHDFDGTLTIHLYGLDPTIIRMHAQKNAQIFPSLVTPQNMCIELWASRGIAYDEAALNEKILVGCAVRE